MSLVAMVHYLMASLLSDLRIVEAMNALLQLDGEQKENANFELKES